MIRFLGENWFWIVLVVAFVAMHRSGMGCGMGHGGHGRHGTDRQHDSDASDRSRDEGARPGR